MTARFSGGSMIMINDCCSLCSNDRPILWWINDNDQWLLFTVLQLSGHELWWKDTLRKEATSDDESTNVIPSGLAIVCLQSLCLQYYLFTIIFVYDLVCLCFVYSLSPLLYVLALSWGGYIYWPPRWTVAKSSLRFFRNFFSLSLKTVLRRKQFGRKWLGSARL